MPNRSASRAAYFVAGEPDCKAINSAVPEVVVRFAVSARYASQPAFAVATLVWTAGVRARAVSPSNASPAWPRCLVRSAAAAVLVFWSCAMR